MEKFKYLPKEKIYKLPKTPGVYAFKKGRDFLYIGKAANLRDRVKQHFKHPRKVLSRAKQLAYIETKSEVKALLLEAKLIKKYLPKYNVAWRDDKNYFYIGISKPARNSSLRLHSDAGGEEFPRVFITHQPNGRLIPGINKLVDTRYLGPFVNGKALKQALKDLRKIYPYRTCKTIPKKPCLWRHLGQCSSPCLLWGIGQCRAEAYDVSNIQGKEATGAMVTFTNGKPDKSFYRKFRIKTVKKPDDVAMIKEIISRRFKHTEWPYPDVVIVDGGRAQLSAAKKICARLNLEQILVAALAKRNNELYMENLAKPVLLKNLPRETFNLILQLRDEAHRFARAYHHKLRDKALLD